MDRLRIGKVVGVEGDTVEVQVTTDQVDIGYQGRVYRVGRLGTYVTIPMGENTIIAYITRVGVRGDLEPGPQPDNPRRVTMDVQLLGTVKGQKFTRGINEYPTLSDSVYIGVEDDFRRIFDSFEDAAADKNRKKSFSFGRFAVDTNFEVKALGKEFFSKHAAVMGNSGSGKSVTTTKILYEAMSLPHAQIVMFDMHGEYKAAFSDEDGNPLPNVTYLSDRNLIMPYWLLQYAEFEKLFLDTNNPRNINAQKVFLRSAFHKLKLAAAADLDLETEYTIDTPIYYSIDDLRTYAENMNDARFVLGTDNYAFSRLPYRQLPPHEQEELLLSKRMEFNQGDSEGEVPHATYFGRLLGLVNQIETRLNDRRYDFLLRPFDQVPANPDLSPFLQEDDPPGMMSRSISAVVRQMLGRLGDRKNLTIVDLSGLPFDVVDVTVAVLTRTLFDFNFWAPPEVRQPFVLVFEEAHNYLPRVDKSNRMFSREAVEKVAKEGRKYGVSAMIVTQRPSEISETILSQCNSMVLMRMNNPDDQDYVARVVADQFRSLIGVLPSMRPGEGFVIGDSVLMPMRTLIDLPPRMPRSGDVDFFAKWCQENGADDAENIIERWWRQDRSTIAEAERRDAERQLAEEAEQQRAAAEAEAAAAGEPPEGLGDGDGAPSSPTDSPRISTGAQQRLAQLAARLSTDESSN